MRSVRRSWTLVSLALACTVTCGVPLLAQGGASMASIPVAHSVAYVADIFNGVYGYAIEPGSGALAPLPGSPFYAGDPQNIAVDPTDRYLYTAGEVEGTFGFKIDLSTGKLSPVPGSPFLGVIFPSGLSIHPSGRFLYMGDGGTSLIYAYGIDQGTGALTPVPGSPFTTGSAPYVSLDPSGRALYASASDGSHASVYGYLVNAKTGALTPMNGSPFGMSELNYFSSVMSKSGSFLFVGSDGAVSAFAVKRDGSLGEVSGSPFLAAGCEMGELAVDPLGKFLYGAPSYNVHGSGEVNLCGFSIDPSGALTSVPGSPLALGELYGFAIDASGQFLYASTSSSTNSEVWGLSINPGTGALTQVPGSPFGAGPWTVGVATTNGFLNFPLRALGPESTSIATVFDHSQTAPYAKGATVSSYTGESGTCNPNNPPQAVKGPVFDFAGFRDESGQPFYVNGNYTGGRLNGLADAETCAGTKEGQLPENTFLFYQGHPGYDYPQGCGTAVFAAGAGIVRYPTTGIPGYNSAAMAKYHIMELDIKDPNGYKIYYLHMETYPANGNPQRCFLEPPLVADGTPVAAGQQIGTVGQAGLPCNNCAHLHFEVRNPVGRPVDPYGWTGSVVPGVDPYLGVAINTRLWNSSK